MEHTYKISGMTCNGCVASVKEKLSRVSDVTDVMVDLQRQEAKVAMNRHVPTSTLKAALPDKYDISEKSESLSDLAIQQKEGKEELPSAVAAEKIQAFSNGSSRVSEPEHGEIPSTNESISNQSSKLEQLKPLLLIFAYLFTTAYLLNFRDWDTGRAMLDFMGLFYIVFSFFKLLDLKGFPDSFRMYDPLAKAVPAYGWIYPFLELALGLMFLFRYQVSIALWTTILILGMTTFGVAKTLLDKKSIRCACLGTALKLPMTEATLIENTIMLIMAIWMLISG